MKTLSKPLLAAASIALIIVILGLAAFPPPIQASNPAQYGGPSTTSSVTGRFACTYVVRPGDDLFRIALRFGVSPFVLAFVNGIPNPNLIFAGMILRVPCPFPPPAPNICDIHIVQRGEWLSMIASRFGVPWQRIAQINHLANPNLIFPGMRLLIPCPSAPVPSGTPAPGAMSVTIQDFMFSPSTIMIHMGQTVMWRNNGPSAHTTTSDSGVWNSGTLGVGATFSQTFNSAGSFPYHCMIHPFMHGTVVVTP